MRPRRSYLLAAAAGVCGTVAQAADADITPAANWRHRGATVVPATPVCPPGVPAAPGMLPGAPGIPAPVPGVPAPGSPATQPPAPVVPIPQPGTPADQPAQTPATPWLSDLTNPTAAAPSAFGDTGSLLAQASVGGTSGGDTALPTVFGDMLGGGTIAGPLAVKALPNGQFFPAPVVIGPNGQRVTLGTQPLPGTQFVDERLATRSPAPPPTAAQLAAAPTVGILPPAGYRFDSSLAAFVAQVPQVYRGAFKIAENDTPRPTTRAYLTYNFYDQVTKNFGGPVPRIMLHQEVFGYEQAFLDRQFAVGIRLPYNQLVSPGFLTNTSLGDLTLIGKAVLLEDRKTGDLLSGGLVITAPTGTVPFANSLTGQVIHDTLIQPYLGYIVTRGDLFAQGFSSIVIPTIKDDVTFMANDLALGYYLYRSAGSRVSAVIPTLEFHLNTPFDHRGANVQPVGFVDQFTVLGGTHFIFGDRSSLGFATGAPITGPRPFSLQATAQLNVRF